MENQINSLSEIANFRLGQHVSVGLDRPEYVRRHGVDLDLDFIVKIADKISQGREGIHVFQDNFGLPLTMVLRGTCEVNGKNYTIFRTMWEGDAGKHNEGERTGLPIIYHFDKTGSGDNSNCKIHGTVPYSHGFCPFCDVQLNSESRRK